MCCINQMCLTCFTTVINKNKPLLQCIICKMQYYSFFTKKMIFIKSDLYIPLVKNKSFVLNELDQIFETKL